MVEAAAAEDKEEAATAKMSTRAIPVQIMRDEVNVDTKAAVNMKTKEEVNVGMKEEVNVGMKEGEAMATATAKVVMKDEERADITSSREATIMNLTTNIVEDNREVDMAGEEKRGEDHSRNKAADMVAEDKTTAMALDNSLVAMGANNNPVDMEVSNNPVAMEVNRKKADVLITKREMMDTPAAAEATPTLAMAMEVVEVEAMEVPTTITLELMLRPNNMLVLQAMETCSLVF